MPASLRNIGTSAFANCANITKISVPQCAVDRDKNITTSVGKISQIFPESYKSINDVHFVGEVTSIGYYAFDQCESLLEINLPDTLQSIGYYSFNKCKFSSITFPSSLRIVGESAFAYCTNLTEVNVNVGLTKLETAAFRACTGLTTISLPNTISIMEGKPFFDCSNMATIYIDLYSAGTGFADGEPWGATDATVIWRPVESGT